MIARIKMTLMAARLTAYVVSLIVGVTFIAGLIVGAQRDDEGPVDLIVTNGHVYTADGDGTMAEAVAVQGNKILRVGTNREIQRLRRAQTVVIDAKGGTVLPGFNDAHMHLLSGALSISEINLLDARTLPEIKQTVLAWTAAHPDREWVIGRGWYYDAFPGGMPTRQLLDELVPDRPAYLTAYDGHSGWANTAALKAARITRKTKNPVNGIIVKDARTGEPTGALKEAAMKLLTPLLPKPSRSDRVAALRTAVARANRFGVTSVQNASGTADDLDLYDELGRNGTLKLRIYNAISVGQDVSPEALNALDELRTKYPDDPLFKTGAAKIVLDGVVESFTAALLEPYATKPAMKGEARLTADALNALVADLDKRGWQIMIHAIGDGAVRMALDAFEHAAEVNPAPARGRRHRIEHIETIDPADISRLQTLGVVASMQPVHAAPDPEGSSLWTDNLGPERAARGWAFASIAKRRGRLVFGSDWPVATMDPMKGLHVAVNRTPLGADIDQDGPAAAPAVAISTERLSLRSAIDAYTRDAAWASFDDHRKGSLVRDMLADMVILNKDLFSAPDRVIDAEVAVTIFDGKVVFQRAVETDN